MDPPVSPRCQKLGPTSGIGLGNVFGVQRILCRTAGSSAKFVPLFFYSSSAGRQAPLAGVVSYYSSPTVTTLDQKKSNGKFSVIPRAFRIHWMFVSYNIWMSVNFK